jgi:O-antigen ligase
LKNVASVKKRSDIEILADFSFFLLLFTELNYKHTIVGQLGIVIFVVAMSLMFLEKRRIYNSFYFIFLALFIIYNFLNVYLGYSISPSNSKSMIFTIISNTIVLFLVFNYLLLRNNPRLSINIFIRAVLFFSSILVVFSGSNLFAGRLAQEVSILGGTNLNSNMTATAFAVGLVLCLYRYFEDHRKSDLLISGWFVFVLMLTGSRKGLLMALVGGFFLLYLIFPRNRIRNTIIAASLCFIAFILLMNVDVLYQIAGSRLEALFSFTTEDSEGDASLMSRNSYILLGWEYFKERPWTGYGLDNFRYFKGAYGTYSHNNYIEILVSGGIPAFLIYYVPIFIIIIQGIRLLRFKIVDSKITDLKALKSIIVLLIIVQILEYASVNYFQRLPLIITVMALVSLRNFKNQKRRLN